MQHTIATEATIEGFGYWTGKDVRVTFEPSRPNTGIVFVREDLPGEPEIPAQVHYRVEKPRQTALKNGAAGVHMIEHVMATLCGLEIDNCRVRVNRPGDARMRRFEPRIHQGAVESPHLGATGRPRMSGDSQDGSRGR